MPAPTKRTRSSTVDEENLPPTPDSARPTRRTGSTSAAPSTEGENVPPGPSATIVALTPTRPHATRSNADNTPPTPLNRTSSSFTPSTRRANGSYPTPTSGLAGPSTYTRLSGSSGIGGVGTLLRTQSSPAVTRSGSELKESIISGGGPGPGRGKGDPEDVFGSGTPGKRFGKGKENIPPKKDSEREQEDSSRKRLRVGSGRGVGSGSGRGRSGSVASVRSESSSSGPSLFSRRSTALPSPSPSPSTATTIDSASSIDPLDSLGEQDTDCEMDVDKTPTKARPFPRRRVTLPTPPPSSPTLMAEMDMTQQRMGMVRVDSSLSLASITSTPSLAATETDAETDQSTCLEISRPTKFKNAYKHLKSFLRLANTSAKSTTAEIVGREDEKAVLRSYFSLRSNLDVGLYVSGPPGTGKTALVTAMGREMSTENWRMIEVGCMGVKAGNVWTRLGEQLGCAGSEEGVRDAISGFEGNTLVVLDEVDSLLPKAPAQPTPATSHLLSRLFSLPLLTSARSIVKFIAISNTLDLTVRARLVLADGAQPQVLPFKAYGAAEMVGIVNSRIAAAAAGADVEADKLVKVDPKAVELLTRKVEAQNGDLRVCLASLSAAVNLAEAEWVKKTLTTETDLADGPPSIFLIKVSLPHVIKAFNSHTQQLKAAAGSGLGSTTSGTPTTRKIRSVPLQGKMVLVSILVYLSRTRAGLPGCPTTSGSSSSTPTNSPNKHGDLTTSTLYATYSAVLSHASTPFPPAPESDYRDLLSNLETLGLVSLFGGTGSTGMSRSGTTGSGTSIRGNKGNGGPRVELCVRPEEVKEGLGLDQAQVGSAKGSADEEVGKVWEREEAKVVKARERLGRAAEALAGASQEL